MFIYCDMEFCWFAWTLTLIFSAYTWSFWKFFRQSGDNMGRFLNHLKYSQLSASKTLDCAPSLFIHRYLNRVWVLFLCILRCLIDGWQTAKYRQGLYIINLCSHFMFINFNKNFLTALTFTQYQSNLHHIVWHCFCDNKIWKNWFTPVSPKKTGTYTKLLCIYWN